VIDPSCLFLHYGTRGLLSQNGRATLSNEATISGRFYEYMPQHERVGAVAGVAIEIAHNDINLDYIVVGPSANGVKISGQYVTLGKCHLYPAYLTGSNSPRALWLTSTASHITCGEACYFDHARVVLETSDVKFLGSRFLTATTDPDFHFIEFVVGKDVGLDGFVVRHCGFHNTRPTVIRAPIAVTSGSIAANQTNSRSCAVDTNYSGP
jgi:hypothetical protein